MLVPVWGKKLYKVMQTQFRTDLTPQQSGRYLPGPEVASYSRQL